MALLTVRKREIMLGILLASFAIVLWRELGTPGSTGRGSGAGSGPAPRVDLASLKVFPVDWAGLAAHRPGYDPAGRNIFQFGVIPPPPPPKLTPAEEAAIREAQRKAAEERERQAELLRQQQEALRQQQVQQQAQQAAQQQAQASLPPPPPPKPQPPPIPYRFIGYLGPPEGKIAVLHDGTDFLFVRQGEVVGQGIKVLEIGYESVKFGFTDPQFKGESRTVPMSSSL